MKITKLLLLPTVLLATLGGIHAQQFSVLIDAPGVQANTVGATAVEPFTVGAPWSLGQQNANVTSSGLSAFTGVFSFVGNTTSILNAEVAGGAGGVGQFVASSTGPFTLSLGSNEANYFGFWFSAGDPFNTLEFYNNGSLVAVFSTAEIFSDIGNPAGQVTSIGGTMYNNSAYYGNPNANQDNPPGTRSNQAEPYSFVNFYGVGSTVYDEIRVSNTDATTSFEADNFTVANNRIPDPSQVGIVVVPEPATAMLFGIGAASVLFFRRRRTA